jgi:hypothetical protein
MKARTALTLLAILLISMTNAGADPDPDFYVFLGFGQSNMDGAGRIEERDRTVDKRFRVLAPMDMPKLGRTKGQWYPATPRLPPRHLLPF